MSKEALRLALVALDIVKIHYTQNRHVNEAITAIKEALAQPEQEPVAVRLSNSVIDCLGTAIVPIGALLYTTPPQRTWAGLTDEEIEDCYKQGGIGRAIQMLKEKNT